MVESGYLEAHNTVNQIIIALENITDALEINGLVSRLDYLIRTLADFENHPQTEIIRVKIRLTYSISPIFKGSL